MLQAGAVHIQDFNRTSRLGFWEGKKGIGASERVGNVEGQEMDLRVVLGLVS